MLLRWMEVDQVILWFFLSLLKRWFQDQSHLWCREGCRQSSRCPKSPETCSRPFKGWFPNKPRSTMARQGGLKKKILFFLKVFFARVESVDQRQQPSPLSESDCSQGCSVWSHSWRKIITLLQHGWSRQGDMAQYQCSHNVQFVKLNQCCQYWSGLQILESPKASPQIKPCPFPFQITRCNQT